MEIDHSFDHSDDASMQIPHVSIDALHGACMLFDSEVELRERTELGRLVRERVTALLSKNPERLMSILYRIDVPEADVHEVMRTVPIPEIATRITSLLLERMEQKMQTRRLYRESKERRDADETR